MHFLKNIISLNTTLKQALEKLNNLPSKDSLTLFVVDDSKKLLGSLTDGDIRRALINNLSIDAPIEKVMNKKPKYIRLNSFTIDEIDLFKEKEIDLVPIIDENDLLIKIVDLSKKKTILPVDAFLLAGGEGKRLLPLTKDTPKPMLVVGEKPIIETNIDRLYSYGIDNISLSVNYLSSIIENYFGNGQTKDLNLSYVKETIPLGTIGSITLCSSFAKNDILVMNSDLLTTIDFEDLYKTYKNSNADIIVACIPYQVSLPYGVIETDQSRVISIKEKPTYTYYSNAGIYLFKRDIIRNIPLNEYYNATDLLEDSIKKGLNVINYPVLNYWLDIGKHDDFIKAQEDIKHLKF
jgi:dTDP-glucose pyrophosphorylase